MTDTEIAHKREGAVRELRLAIVCYGGVSLAIYMHGITKEIHRLVKASAALAEDPERNPFAGGTERVYWDLLRRIAEGEVGDHTAGTSVRVVVDIISGTSAGGINGVFLAKALAHDRSQEALKQLWFEKGDVKQLLRGWRAMPWLLRFGWIGLRAVRRPLKVRPPLRGDAMCQWLHGALDDMDETAAPGVDASLVPDDLELKLFVPITDFNGYDREIPLYDPRFVRDRTHRHIMKFRHSGGRSDFTKEFNDALAFAARATSSFPGAFPPIDFTDYESCFPGRPVNLRDVASQLFPLYKLAGTEPAQTFYVDGGVLDNFPFQSAIEAIGSQPAATEVDRRLLYIEPDPGGGVISTPSGTAAPVRRPPGIYKTIFGGYASIPRKEPILDDLLKLAVRNEAVLRVRDVIESSFDTMRNRVEAMVKELGPSVLVPGVAGKRLAEIDGRLQEQALDEAGFGAGTYLRLRVRSTVDEYSAIIGDVLEFTAGSFQAAAVASVLRRWAVEDGLLRQRPDDEEYERRRLFLSTLDLGYRERRIRFLISAVNWLYADAGQPGRPTRTELDEAKRRFYRQLGKLRATVADLARDDGVRGALQDVFADEEVRTASEGDELDAAGVLSRHRDVLVEVRDQVRKRTAAALPAVDEGLHSAVLELIGCCADDVGSDMVTRYLGFPFWDLLVYPLQAMSGVGERDHVEVYRMSPQDVTLLAGDAERSTKYLKGMSLGHFGAFFSRASREGDYLWGRLHAVERLTKLLLDVRRKPSTLSTGSPAAAPPSIGRDLLARECSPGFRAVLDEEASALPGATRLVDMVRAQVNDLPS